MWHGSWWAMVSGGVQLLVAHGSWWGAVVGGAW